MGLPALKDALPPVVRAIREPAKVIAFRARVSARTVEGIKQSEHGVSGETLIQLARAFPEIKSLVIELIGGVENDPAYLMFLLNKYIQGKQ
jgi:hypothetical protein